MFHEKEGSEERKDWRVGKGGKKMKWNVIKSEERRLGVI